MNITVLMGGTSAERNVSLASGLRIAEALRARGHVVRLVDPARDVISDAEEARLRSGGVPAVPPTVEELEELARSSVTASLGSMAEVREADVVFLALHGGEGEDGTVQALLDMAGVRYTGSGRLASALAMDKDLSKRLFRTAGVTTADWLMAPSEADEGGPLWDAFAQQAATLGSKVVVKPSKQGSTVGLSVVTDPADLRAAVVEARRYDDEVMVERFVAGREFTVGVLGDQALPVGEIIASKEIYDYECKYTAGMAREEFPAKLSDAERLEMQRQALASFEVLKLRGYARIDFRMSASGECFCLEANTLPGMTALSLIPQGAAAAGIDFGDLCERVVRSAVRGAVVLGAGAR
jgi:D-alanine-D-alanine ligase